MPMIRDDDEDENSVEDDLNALQDHFATLLNIHEDPSYPQPQTIWQRESSFPPVGESNPRPKNLGNSWEIRYKSVTSLLPTNDAASRLSSFYQRIVEIAAERIGSSATSLKSLDFRLNDIFLRLNSPTPISWEWVIRFARGMLQASRSGWPILYDASARNAYWDLAVINVVLNVHARVQGQ